MLLPGLADEIRQTAVNVPVAFGKTDKAGLADMNVPNQRKLRRKHL